MSSNQLAVLAILQFIFAIWLGEDIKITTSNGMLWVLQVTSWALYVGAFAAALTGLIKQRKNKSQQKSLVNLLANAASIIIVLLIGLGVLFLIFLLIAMRNFTF